MSKATDLGRLTGDHTIDPVHSRLGFVARHAMVTASTSTTTRRSCSPPPGCGLRARTRSTSPVISRSRATPSRWSSTWIAPARPGPVRRRPRRVEGGLQVNREDWGLTWNAALGPASGVVGEKITVELDISAVKEA